MRTALLVFLGLLLCSSGSFAQVQQVTGTVIDNQGMPIPGVSVIEQGTTNGVVTDFDGNFSIEVPDTAVLLFRYLGYTTM